MSELLKHLEKLRAAGQQQLDNGREPHNGFIDTRLPCENDPARTYFIPVTGLSDPDQLIGHDVKPKRHGMPDEI